MKKLHFVFIFTCILQSVQAQYCGSSGNFSCFPADSIPSPGYYPSPDSLPSFINNLQTQTTIAFQTFDSILFGEEVLHVYHLTIDSINNLPPGLCWSADQLNNTYETGQKGCVQFSGTPCGPTGQYKLVTILTLDIGSPVTTDGDGGGFEYFVRLKNYGTPDIPVDPSQTDSTPVIYSGDTCHPELPLSISLGDDSIFCAGTIISFNPDITGGLPPYSYSWNSSSASLSCTSCSSPVTTLYQNSSFTLTVSDANNETAGGTVNYITTGNIADYHLGILGPVVNCDSGTVVLFSNAGLSLQYQWLKNNSVIPGATQSSYTIIDSPGIYELQYENPGLCSATSNQVQISFPASPKVTLNSEGTANLCSGSVVILQANATGMLNFQWQLNNNNIPDSIPTYLIASQPGNYRLIVNTPEFCYDTSNVITIVPNSNPPTLVTFAEYFGDTICNNTPPFALAGGTPSGGLYSGTGVFNNTFNPDSAAPGSNVITYLFTDNNGCSSLASDSITVVLCTGTETTTNNSDLLVFPNPASDKLFMECDKFVRGKISFDIYDEAGKQINLNSNSKSRVQANVIAVDVSNLSPGLYFLHIATGGRNIIKRFIKID